jgi:hypothetical protein
VKPAWLSLAALSLAVTVAAPAGAQSRSFNLASAYPCTISGYDSRLGITDPQVFAGTCPAQDAVPSASPGVLCLARDGLTLDVNCFAVVPRGQVGPCQIQFYRLIKTVPGSIKCPDVYGSEAQSYIQYGIGIRTWWALAFTQPGTQFILEVVSACRTASTPSTAGGEVRIHKDFWSWQVVTSAETLGDVIDLMHAGAVGTLEAPCILGEDLYDALKIAQRRLADALAVEEHTDRMAVEAAILDLEALIIANCLFVEMLNPLATFPGPDQFGAHNIQPPGNLAQVVFLARGSAIAGIIDTIEHPCCCKLLVDLEWIAAENV